MVKKLRALTSSDDNQLIEAVRNSAHLIWQAGLGAFSRAQEEGDKVFTNLINAGSDLQRRMRGADEGGSSDLGLIGRTADTIGRQAADSWVKVEHVFEDRLARALQNIGVPSRDDVQQLAAQIEELRKLLEGLPDKGAVSGKAPVAASAKGKGKKPAAKAMVKTVRRTGAKKPAAKAGKTGAGAGAGGKAPGPTV